MRFGDKHIKGVMEKPYKCHIQRAHPGRPGLRIGFSRRRRKGRAAERKRVGKARPDFGTQPST